MRRSEFLIPEGSAYFCGNSLGLQPKAARAAVEAELEDWARLGVKAHFEGRDPWFSYHEQFRDSGARLVGAKPGEVVMMNSLSVNLHLMMTTFFRPEGERTKILIDEPAFPSDGYAVRSQLRLHGLDPAEHLIRFDPAAGDLFELLEEEGESIALVLMNGVNFFTGEWFDMKKVTAAARAQGCRVGWDLAHAAGNVPMELHAWDVDFACWCSYKYLNAGPGAVGGCFVHERHGADAALLRLAGWWGNDPQTRFRMQLEPEFVPRAGADGWQLSNPPILALAPLKASLALFDEVGMDALRARSLELTGKLEKAVEDAAGERIEILTPRDPARRGAQLSLRVKGGADALFRALDAEGVVCDQRKPDVLRVAPAPLYNDESDLERFAAALKKGLA